MVMQERIKLTLEQSRKKKGACAFSWSSLPKFFDQGRKRLSSLRESLPSCPIYQHEMRWVREIILFKFAFSWWIHFSMDKHWWQRYEQTHQYLHMGIEYSTRAHIPTHLSWTLLQGMGISLSLTGGASSTFWSLLFVLCMRKFFGRIIWLIRTLLFDKLSSVFWWWLLCNYDLMVALPTPNGTVIAGVQWNGMNKENFIKRFYGER